MPRTPLAVTALLVGLLLANDASACRQGRLAYPPEVGTENSALLQTVDHVFVGRISTLTTVGFRVSARIEPTRVIRGSAEVIAFNDQMLPSTCPGVASRRLGTLWDGMPVLVLREDGPEGFTVLATRGVLLMMGANDLLALIEPERGE